MYIEREKSINHHHNVYKNTFHKCLKTFFFVLCSLRKINSRVRKWPHWTGKKNIAEIARGQSHLSSFYSFLVRWKQINIFHRNVVATAHRYICKLVMKIKREKKFNGLKSKGTWWMSFIIFWVNLGVKPAKSLKCFIWHSHSDFLLDRF